MKLTATKLEWILDKNGARLGDETKIRENIDFVHSLKLKCDSVGWSTLDLSRPDAAEILNRIDDFCTDGGWTMRAHADLTCEVDSDWYELVFQWIPDAMEACPRFVEAPGADGNAIFMPVVKAFGASGGPWITGSEQLLVPDALRTAFIEADIPGLRFCWVEDRGRYDAKQVYTVYADRFIPRIGGEAGFRYSTDRDSEIPAVIDFIGGFLPRIARMCTKLNVALPGMYLRRDMPASGVAEAFYPQLFNRTSHHSLLLHRDTAEKLLKSGALKPSMLCPAIVVDEFPAGYPVYDGQAAFRPKEEYFARMEMSRDMLLSKPRPARIVTDKDAVKLLRQAKKERKEDFRKALKKADCEALSGTEYAALAPYYAVTEGGYLSDEYRLLSPAESAAETPAFHDRMTDEELAEPFPGVLIANCADGDVVLLRLDGRVQRISHEEPVAIQEWNSLAYFIVDALSE